MLKESPYGQKSDLILEPKTLILVTEQIVNVFRIFYRCYS